MHAERQIKNQIEGGTLVTLIFSDADTFIKIYEQCEKDEIIYFIQPAFCFAKEISAELYQELMNSGSIESEFNTDILVVRRNEAFSEFYNKYYNSLPVSNRLKTL